MVKEELEKTLYQLDETYSEISPVLNFTKLPPKEQGIAIALQGIGAIVGLTAIIWMYSAMYLQNHNYLPPIPIGPSVVMNSDFLKTGEMKPFYKNKP